MEAPCAGVAPARNIVPEEAHWRPGGQPADGGLGTREYPTLTGHNGIICLGWPGSGDSERMEWVVPHGNS